MEFIFYYKMVDNEDLCTGVTVFCIRGQRHKSPALKKSHYKCFQSNAYSYVS